MVGLRSRTSKGDDETGAGGIAAVECERAAKQLCRAAGYRQPQSDTLFECIYFIEPLEYLLLMFGRYAYTRILYLDPQLAAGFRQPDGHTALLGKLEGIAQQPGEDLAEGVGVAADGEALGQTALNGELKATCALLRGATRCTRAARCQQQDDHKKFLNVSTYISIRHLGYHINSPLKK